MKTFAQRTLRPRARVGACPGPAVPAARGRSACEPPVLLQRNPAVQRILQAKAVSGGTCPSAPAGGRDEQEEAPVQTKARAGGAADVGRPFEARLQRSFAGGRELPAATRSDMEARFGQPFDRVRVHTDRDAVEMAQQLNAEAFATGDHIYLDAGRYAPESPAGKRLLAHELTHVLQQRSTGRETIRGMRISSVDPGRLQGYKLKGFPPAKEALMHAAIPVAISKVASCDWLTWWGKMVIKSALRRSRYDFVPDLGICGWTFPASWYIEVGEEAFDAGKCCDLASTLAHEASHTEWYTEGRARRMECNCFGCSC